MYHPSKVADRIRTELDFTPVRHSVAEVETFESYLRDEHKYILDDQGRPTSIDTANLVAWESEWIMNERALVMVDATYAVTRYGWLIDEAGVICRFRFRVAQEILFGVLGDLELMGGSIEVMILKARQLGMCLAPHTRVLTSDLRWVPIDDVKIGDELVAVDEYPRQGKAKKRDARRMRTATVRGRSERVHETMEITLSTGAKIVATPEHPFLCRKRGGFDPVWRRTGEIRVGDNIRRLVDVWEEGDKEDAWLGGLIDGEGSLRGKMRAGTEFSLSQVPGGVLDRARGLMSERYSPVREEIDNRKAGNNSKLGNKPVHKLVIGRSETLFKLMGCTRPTRFISQRWWEDRELPGKKVGGQWATVTEIKSVGKQRVVNLDTTTGTFIAEGVVSHNTSLVELLIMFRVVFGYGVNAVIASADQEKSRLMMKKLLFAYDRLPVWLRPHPTSRVESDRGKLEFGSIDSGVSVQHGNQMSGIARGATPTIYHLSECASFGDPEALIEASLFKAVHGSPNVFGILESTGEGDVGWWPSKWRTSKAKWLEGGARLYPLFLPFFVGIGMWPDEGWLKKHPVPPGWYEQRLPDTREQVLKAELYVRTHDLIRKHLCEPHPNAPPEMRDWWVDGQMPLAQQWFWEVDHEEHKASGAEATFFQEMACDDIEALQRSSDSVFGYEVMDRVDRERQRAVSVYGITGQSIEDAYEPPTEDIDYSAQRIPVQFRNPKGPVYNWELIPLRHDSARIEGWMKTNPDAFWDSAAGKLFVWHPPRPGVDYSIGIDSGEGKGLDSTVISVAEVAPRAGMPDRQAAEFRSPYVSHVQAYAFVMAIAAFYASAMTAELHRQPLVAPEVVASVGDIALVQMRQMGYSRFFRFTRYDNAKSTKSNKLGWYTFAWSRPILIGGFIDTIENGWYELNSPWTLHECRHFESHSTASGKIKQEHEDGEHDDGIFAAAISIEIVRGKQSKTERSEKRYMGDPSADSLPPLDLRPSLGTRFPSGPLDRFLPVPLDDL